MTNREALDKLQELEQFFFYKWCNADSFKDFRPELHQIHADIKTALAMWWKLTGTTIEEGSETK